MLFRGVILDINLPYEGSQSDTGTQKKYLGPGTHELKTAEKKKRILVAYEDSAAT